MSNQSYSNENTRYFPSPLSNVYTISGTEKILTETPGDGAWTPLAFDTCNGTVGQVISASDPYLYKNVHDIMELGQPIGITSASALVTSYIRIMTDGVYNIDGTFAYTGETDPENSVITVGFGIHVQTVDGTRIYEHGQNTFYKFDYDEVNIPLSVTKYFQAGQRIYVVYSVQANVLNLLTNAKTYLRISKL